MVANMQGNPIFFSPCELGNTNLGLMTHESGQPPEGIAGQRDTHPRYQDGAARLIQSYVKCSSQSFTEHSSDDADSNQQEAHADCNGLLFPQQQPFCAHRRIQVHRERQQTCPEQDDRDQPKPSTPFNDSEAVLIPRDLAIRVRIDFHVPHVDWSGDSFHLLAAMNVVQECVEGLAHEQLAKSCPLRPKRSV